MQDERGNKTNIGSTYKFVNMPILNPLSANITKWRNIADELFECV